MVVIGVTIAAGMLAMTAVDKRKEKEYRASENRRHATNSLKQIGPMLIEFDSEYGQLPDAATIPAVKDKTRTPLTLGSGSSNALFRQLLLGEYGSGEKPFWVRTADSPNLPDEVFTSDAKALVKGECVYSYVAGLKASDDGETPVVMAPLLPGKLVFDREIFNGKAMILSLDNSVRRLPIEEDGRVLVNGMDMFDPKQPFWKGKKPDVKWPE